MNLEQVKVLLQKNPNIEIAMSDHGIKIGFKNVDRKYWHRYAWTTNLTEVQISKAIDRLHYSTDRPDITRINQ